jgi:peroxiredoxin Q/BCP
MMFRSIIVATALCGASAFAPISAPQTASTALNLAVGETAPAFALEDQNGKVFKSTGSKKPLVVYFYPADATPGCTVQATSFNDQVKDIRKQYGADVVGISGQDVESKQAFAADLRLDFSILADEGDAVRKEFNVPKAFFGALPGRVTYVLDGNRECIATYSNLADAASHVGEAKKALDTIEQPKKMFSFF